jgi:chromosome segregation ATPase
MRMFRTRAEADAKDLGGRIDEAATEGDDLSTQVVDTEAAQRARAAEQARLTELMQRRTSNLQDTLAVEQEITRVQGEMDQAASELKAMRTRIVMQTVTVAYASPAVVAPKGASAPLEAAERGFMGNVYGVLAALLTLGSVLLPVGLIAAPILWLIARARKKAPAIQKTAG